MKKNILEKTGKVLSTVAKAAVLIEVNSTCPFAVYQPKLPESVEKMRKKEYEDHRKNGAAGYYTERK